MGIVPVGTAKGTCISSEDRAHNPSVRGLQDVRAVHLFRSPVISAEDADFGLLFVPGRGFAHLPLHPEQVEPGEAPTKAHLSLGLHVELVLERAEDGETLLQVQDGGRGGAPGRAAAVHGTALPNAARDYARTGRGIIQTQSRLQRLGDGVGVLRHAEFVILRHQRRQPQIVVPEIKSIVIRAARVQIGVIKEIHGGGWRKGETTTVIRKSFVARVGVQDLCMQGGEGLQWSSDVCASSVWLSGFKEQEGGALLSKAHF